MKKKIILSSLLVSLVTLAFYSLNNVKVSQSNHLLLSNVEALSSSAESGILIYRFCSKKPGKEYCSAKRGHRKWTQDVTFVLGATSNYCPDCPDDDYELAE